MAHRLSPVLYRIEGDKVLIQRVVRGSRDLGALFSSPDE